MTTTPALDTDDELVDLAARAFIYGFPLVFNLDQVRRYASVGVGANPAAPYNTFSHARTLAGPADKFVTINNDTLYSMAQLDLSNGPLLLEVPNTGDRYYVLQFVSAWTENFAYIGKRATGTDAGRYLIAPPGWTGKPPAGAEVVNCPTTIASIVGRWAVRGAGDLEEVHALQDATTIRPVNPGPVARGVPDAPAGDDEALGFWERYRVWSRAYAPPARDAELQASFAALGLTADTPISDAPDAVRSALRKGHAAGLAFLQAALRGGHTPQQNGWLLTLHVFDYNLDHFSVGTIDSPEWRIDDPEERLVIRAGAALGGLWGNHAYEAAYLGVYVDGDGAQLDGSNRYELRLDPPPPNDGFWSLTMYDVPDYYLVANPIHRYSIGDRTPGLVTEPDGAVTITISHDPPSASAAASNWLPAPPGPFRPMLRVYSPHASVLDGSYVLPAIRRVG